MKKTKEFSNRKKPKCGSLASIYKKCIYSQKKLKGQKKKKINHLLSMILPHKFYIWDFYQQLGFSFSFFLGRKIFNYFLWII